MLLLLTISIPPFTRAQTDAENANAAQRENESAAQSWHASNGFLQRSAPDPLVMPKDQPAPANPKQQYKHLITDRGFEDILQACHDWATDSFSR